MLGMPAIPPSAAGTNLSTNTQQMIALRSEFFSPVCLLAHAPAWSLQQRCLPCTGTAPPCSSPLGGEGSRSAVVNKSSSSSSSNRVLIWREQRLRVPSPLGGEGWQSAVASTSSSSSSSNRVLICTGTVPPCSSPRCVCVCGGVLAICSSEHKHQPPQQQQGVDLYKTASHCSNPLGGEGSQCAVANTSSSSSSGSNRVLICTGTAPYCVQVLWVGRARNLQ
jgi:hypothetical protein